MKNKDLIYDGDKIRNCPSNKAKLGYWRTLWNFEGYWIEIKYFLSFATEIAEALFLMLSVIGFFVFFPIIPFIRAFFVWRSAVKKCKKQEKIRKQREAK